MSLPRIVCPHNQRLLRTFSGQSVAVQVDHWEKTAEAADDVCSSGNELFCVIVDTTAPLDEIVLPDDWKQIPLAIMVPTIGKFRNLTAKLKAWRDFNLRVFLSCDHADNRAALRILSSLGIQTCAVFGSGKDDWEALSDLMTYAVLGQLPHASIDPFSFIATNHQPNAWFDWGALYFDDPKYFLHLDDQGRVALSRAALAGEEFVAQSLAECGAAAEFPAIKHREQTFMQYFLDNHACSFCPGWKLCLGRFSASVPQDNGCSGFFREMIDVSRQFKRLNVMPQDKQVWRP